MKKLFIIIIALFIVQCSNQTVKIVPSPIPLDLNYSWKYYHKNPLDGSVKELKSHTIIDTVRHEGIKYYKVEEIDKLFKITSFEYWRWNDPQFEIYFRNKENKLIEHMAYSTTLNDTLIFGSYISILKDTTSTFNDYTNCWKYEVSPSKKLIQSYKEKFNREMINQDPTIHYIKPQIGFANKVGGYFLGNFKLNL